MSRADVSAALMTLRAAAKLGLDRWHKAELSDGLRLAWRIRDETRVETLAIQRALPLAPEELVAIMALLPERLAPFERTEGRDGAVVYSMLPEQVCDRCAWPMDAAGKAAGGPRCSTCNGKTTRCRDCGATTGEDVTFGYMRCNGCAMAAGRAEPDERREREAVRVPGDADREAADEPAGQVDEAAGGRGVSVLRE